MESELRVQVVDDEIIVTRPGSYYSVTYYKLPSSPGPLAKRMPAQDDLRFSMTAAEFLEAAWKVANHKATELGWFGIEKALKKP
jgi:hypothetical protein